MILVIIERHHMDLDIMWDFNESGPAVSHLMNVQTLRDNKGVRAI
jgi:hypothetical protein